MRFRKTLSKHQQSSCQDAAESHLAVVVQAPGDEMGFDYDLGDNWMHEIRVISIFPPEESNGRCQVLLSFLSQ